MSEWRAVWLSRHPLAKEAIEFLEMDMGFRPLSIETREVIWSDNPDDCMEVLQSLRIEFDLVLGVFPSQVQACISELAWTQGYNACMVDVGEELETKNVSLGSVHSVVSVPEKEPDTGKVRGFRFSRIVTFLEDES